MSIVRVEEGEILCNCSFQASLCGLAEEGPYKYVCKTRGGCLKHVYRPDPVTHPEIIRTEYRCVLEYHWTPPERPIMCYTRKDMAYKEKTECCKDANYCSANLNVTLADAPPDSDAEAHAQESSWRLGLFVGVPLAILVILLLFYLLFRKYRLQPAFKRIILKERMPSSGDSGLSKKPLMEGAASTDVRTLTTLLLDAVHNFEDPTSGSGSGLPLLVQRTVARQIELEKKVGEGRFGMVWLASWKGEECAVKIFETRDEKSWFREVEIFQTNMLRHPNILTFFASDNKDASTHTQLWLVTEYHAAGSLFDHLRGAAVSLPAASLLARSLANGLAFLHAENVGTHSKPAIAHRDIKSKNILVKANRECCIADLGMAVRYSAGVLDLPDNGKVGTRRYCAPEVLDDSMNTKQFESFRRADIYSTGLTLWEICRRTDFDGMVDPYELPYYEFVDADPSQEQMRSVVCEEKRRPSIPNKWMNHKTIDMLSARSLEPSLAKPAHAL